MPPADLAAQARQPALAGRPNGVKWQKRIKMNKSGKRKTEGLRPETRESSKSQFVIKCKNEENGKRQKRRGSRPEIGLKPARGPPLGVVLGEV